MNALERLLSAYEGIHDSYFLTGYHICCHDDSKKVTLGELRAYAEELKQKPLVRCETCANALEGRTTDEIRCNYWLLENPSTINAWYLPKVMRITCSHYIPRSKKVRKAQWVIKQVNGECRVSGVGCLFTREQITAMYGDHMFAGETVVGPVQGSWKEVEEWTVNDAGKSWF